MMNIKNLADLGFGQLKYLQRRRRGRLLESWDLTREWMINKGTATGLLYLLTVLGGSRFNNVAFCLNLRFGVEHTY